MRRAIVIMFLGAALVSCGGSISCTGTLEPDAEDGAGGSPGFGGAPAAGGVGGAGGVDAGEDVEDVGRDVQDAGCIGPNPAGCFHNAVGCRAGETCEAVGCTPSYCFCAGEVWGCTKDCGGGSCVPAIDAGPDVIEND